MIFDVKEYRKLFFESLIKSIKEDKSRQDKYLEEDKILQDIKQNLKNSKSTDIVYKSFTQQQMYDNLHKSILFKVDKFNVLIYFSEKKDINAPNECSAGFDIKNRIIYICLSEFGIKLIDDLEASKEIILDELQSNKDLIEIMHHEIAHMMFFDRFKNIKQYHKFCAKSQQIGKNLNVDEYNSLISELFYLMIKENESINTTGDIWSFLFRLPRSNTSYSRDLFYSLLMVGDMKKLAKDILRFSQKNNQMNVNKVLSVLETKLQSSENKYVNSLNELSSLMKRNGFDNLKIRDNTERMDQYYLSCFKFLKKHSDPSLNLNSEFNRLINNLEKIITEGVKLETVDLHIDSILSPLKPEECVRDDQIEDIVKFNQRKRKFMEFMAKSYLMNVEEFEQLANNFHWDD